MVMKGTVIDIVGPNKLQNELLAFSLQKETALTCRAVENYAELECDRSAGDEQHLVLYDCLAKDVDACMQECIPLIEKKPGTPLLCLFNLSRGTGLEGSLLMQGARGFFYLDEPFQNLAKGVLAVLDGEFWVPRKIMTGLIEKNAHGTKKARQNILSRREVDILDKIVEGATNEEIADKLCISRHTVKTHLYNIFKKLNVKSRFQAALWAAKNL